MISVRLFLGSLRPLPGDGSPTGMFKDAATGPVFIDSEGCRGDEQADRHAHGGPDKALHLFPAEHYSRLAECFPAVAGQLIPGSLGENLSTLGLTETDVCIGDIFRLGSARIQVNQPRHPCWKIDARFGVTGIAADIATKGMTGWYWRVLASGRAESGDTLELLDRPPKGITLAAARAIWLAEKPALAELERVAAAPGIAVRWRAHILARADALRRHPDQPPPGPPAVYDKPRD